MLGAKTLLFGYLWGLEFWSWFYGEWALKIDIGVENSRLGDLGGLETQVKMQFVGKGLVHLLQRQFCD